MTDKAASALAKKRWQGVSADERAELMSNAAKSRWKNKTEEQRKAEGKRLAAARKRAPKKRQKHETPGNSPK